MTSPSTFRPPRLPAFYKPAREIGRGFNVYGQHDRLVAWVAEEPIAQSMVKRLNGEGEPKPREGQLASTEREGPSCKG